MEKIRQFQCVYEEAVEILSLMLFLFTNIFKRANWCMACPMSRSVWQNRYRRTNQLTEKLSRIRPHCAMKEKQGQASFSQPCEIPPKFLIQFKNNNLKICVVLANHQPTISFFHADLLPINYENLLTITQPFSK